MNIKPLFCSLYLLVGGWQLASAQKPRILVLADIAPLSVEPDDLNLPYGCWFMPIFLK